MKMLFGLIVVCLMASSLFAISSATATSSQVNYRWAGNTTGGVSATTQGGNISYLNISTTQLTSKWASFFGNVAGTIRLSDTQAGNAVYVWTYSSANGGEVCVSTNGTFPVGTLVDATAANIETAFTTNGAPDNAAGTFNTTCPTLTIGSTSFAGFAAARHQGSSTFTTCAASIGGTTAGNMAFCTNITVTGTGKNFNNTNVNYELMVPSTASVAGPYYFYMELS
jgi:hypothetical protein